MECRTVTGPDGWRKNLRPPLFCSCRTVSIRAMVSTSGYYIYGCPSGVGILFSLEVNEEWGTLVYKKSKFGIFWTSKNDIWKNVSDFSERAPSKILGAWISPYPPSANNVGLPIGIAKQEGYIPQRQCYEYERKRFTTNFLTGLADYVIHLRLNGRVISQSGWGQLSFTVSVLV